MLTFKIKKKSCFELYGEQRVGACTVAKLLFKVIVIQ